MRLKYEDRVWVSDLGEDENFSGFAVIKSFLQGGKWVAVDLEDDLQIAEWGPRMEFHLDRIIPADEAPKLNVSTKRVQAPVLDWGERQRFRDPETGYEKDTSLYRFDLIPADALAEVAKVYGVGEQKYPSGPEGPNWIQGGPLWPSRAALSRHLAAYDLGEDVDPSDDTYHLAKVAWHAFALLVHGPLRGTGVDTRGLLKKKEVS